MVGAASAGCPSCSRLVGLAPLVPIVPDIHAEVHRQWKSYGGFTFAFQDYVRGPILSPRTQPNPSHALLLPPHCSH